MGCGLLLVYERVAGKFFFSPLVFFRGIRDDIEEEDEQVSEPSKVFKSTTMQIRDVLPVLPLIF